MFQGSGTRFGQFRPDDITAGAIVLAFVAAAMTVGYIVASGQPVPIVLSLGLIAGIALLSALPFVIWIVLGGVLVVSGPVIMFFPGLDKVAWLFSLLGFFLAGASILYPAASRNRFSKPFPAFVSLAILVFALGLISLVYSGGPLGEGVRALKRYFQFFGLLFVLAVIPFPASLARRWWIFLIALAVLQLPFAIYQRIVLVPMREGIPRVYPEDIIVGTMEGSMLGGGSFGVMTMLLVFMLAFLLAAYRDNLLSMRWLVILSLAVAAPLAIGTATVVIVLLPVALLAVHFDLIRRRPIRFVLGLAVTLPLLAVLGWLYLSYQADAAGEPIERRIEALVAYNFGDTGYYGTGLNRTNIYAYWLRHQSLSDPLGFLFGHGLGSSFGGINELDPGHMDRAHSGMYIGLTAASSVLWDLGAVGFFLYVALFLSAARCAMRLSLVAHAGADRASCRALFAMALMQFTMFFHSNAPISVPSHEVLTALTLGLIAWRWRSQGTPGQTSAMKPVV